MRLKEISIYGYGKIHNATFSDLQGLSVFFGENEAGKSTLMSFIHSILFGFPLKNQNDNRYEPKDFSAYGGKLLIESDRYGEVLIQRIKGKAASGDVTVTFQDGRTGSQADLDRLLLGIDKTAYQRIYSFDLQGLNGLSDIDEKDISRYLLSSGMMGSDGLFRTEQRLQKKMDQLFKPSGKLPLVNAELNELQQRYGRLQQAGQEQDRYDEWQENLKNLEKEHAEVERQLGQTQEEIISSYNYISAEPLLIEETRINDKLNVLGDFSFREESKDELLALKEVLLPVDTTLHTVQKQLDSVQLQMGRLEIDKRFAEEKEHVRQLIDQAGLYENMIQEQRRKEQSLESVSTEIQQLRDYMHISLAEEEILLLDSSSIIQEQILSIQNRFAKLENDKTHLDQKQEREESALRMIEQRLSFLNEQILPDDEREQIDNQVERNRKDGQNEVELAYIERSISKLEMKIEKTKKKEKQKRSNYRSLMLGLYAICAILLVLLIIQQNWLAALVVGAALVALFFFRTAFAPVSVLGELSEEMNELISRKEKCAAQAGTSSQIDVQQARQLQQKDDELRQRFYSEKIKQEEHEHAFHQTVDEFEQWEKNMVDVQEEIHKVLSGWQVPQEVVPASLLQSMYEAIVSLKQSIYTKRQLQGQLEESAMAVEAYKKRIVEACTDFLGRKPSSLSEGNAELKKALERLEEEIMKKRQLLEQAGQLEKQAAELKVKSEHLHKQINDLLNKAECTDEASFMEKARQAEEKQALEKQLQTIRIQLKPYEEERVQWSGKQIVNDYSIGLLKEKKQQLEKKKNELIKTLADVRHTIKALEEGGTYDERLFEFQTKQSEVNENAREWMKLSLAKALLEKTVDQYKKETLPAILRQATDYTSLITDGKYVSLQWGQEEEGLVLQRKDGLLFEAKEVSRGTQEAIYIGLRLALAQHSYQEDPLPIIIDDSFVNLDLRRLRKIIELLKEMQVRHQIILFTCHEYIVEHLADQQIIRMG
ncbi:AAA family ATPase [Bacillus sp. 1P06AnD]|uniref:ATP-binding protein n=1 Tax=Bacillus sp. 1P06AnD TaxID=3132208 RepID=UPI00399F21AD